MFFTITSRSIYGSMLLALISSACLAMDNSAQSGINSLLEYALKSAPEELQLFAKEITTHAEKPCFPERILLLIGTHGSGKTTLAKAILHQCKTHHQGIITHHLNSESQLTDSIDRDKKTVIVFDNIDSLCTADRSNTALPKILNVFDTLQDNLNLFIIGTLKQIESAPESLKSRALGNMVLLPELTMEQKISHIRTLFEKIHGCTLPTDCTNQFLDAECITKINAQTYRDLGALISKTLYLHRKQPESAQSDTITCATLSAAVAQIVQEQSKMQPPATPYGLSQQEIDEVKQVVTAAQTTQTYDIDAFTRELGSMLLNQRQQQYALDLLKQKDEFRKQQKEEKKKKNSWF